MPVLMLLLGLAGCALSALVVLAGFSMRTENAIHQILAGICLLAGAGIGVGGVIVVCLAEVDSSLRLVWSSAETARESLGGLCRGVGDLQGQAGQLRALIAQGQDPPTHMVDGTRPAAKLSVDDEALAREVARS